MTNAQAFAAATLSILSPRRRPHFFDSGKSAAINGLHDAVTSLRYATKREHDDCSRGKYGDSVPVPCVHYVGFRDDRYWNAYRIWGGPRVIHRWWDRRAQREIHPDDIVIFAEGDWWQEPRQYNAPDITEAEK